MILKGVAGTLDAFGKGELDADASLLEIGQQRGSRPAVCLRNLCVSVYFIGEFAQLVVGRQVVCRGGGGWIGNARRLFAIARALAALAFDAKFVAALGSLHGGASPSMVENAPAAEAATLYLLQIYIYCSGAISAAAT
jgi:hypothetical protein